MIIYDKDNKPFSTGWREIDRSKLWYISLKPDLPNIPPCPEDTDATPEEATLEAYSAYVLPSVESLFKYFHAAAGYPVRSTWLTVTKAGKIKTWPVLTYNNARQYCPFTFETTKGHMVQTRQNAHSAKLKESEVNIVKQQFMGAGYGAKTRVDELSDMEEPPPGNDSVNELHVKVLHQSKLYTYDTGRFPTRARSGNQYVMVAYHSSNVILFETFESRKDKHCLAAYNFIMQQLKDKHLLVDLQILDKESSK